MSEVERLTELRDAITAAKQAEATSQARLDEILRQIKQTANVGSVDDALKLKKKLTTERDKLVKERDEGIRSIQERFEF